MYYSHVNDVRVAEYGLLQSQTHPFIGASPDGICERRQLYGNGLSKLVGRLLEIKCPRLRQIKTTGNLDGDICPHYYFVQVQTQLFVTDMDECDFLQCKIDEYDSWEEYISDTGTKPWLSRAEVHKGCVIQLAPIKFDTPEARVFNSQYLYPPHFEMTPKGIKSWIAKCMINWPNNKYAETHVIDKIIYWRLTKVACNLIHFDREWFEGKIPMIKQFWDYVIYYRENKPALDKLHAYIQSVGVKSSKEIFQKIHEEYGIYDAPLYQTPTPWRKKYEAIKARYRR